MKNKKLNKIFLSASIPYLERDKKYFDTADFIAIRDAVRALASVVIPKAHLVWGGHPAITPLIHYVMKRMDADLKTHVTLYQSNFFRDFFPKDNIFFENVVITPEKEDVNNSVAYMRERMFDDNKFDVGIFIGGMDGIEIEYNLFREANPHALVLPIASTGAAAKIVYENLENQNERLLNDYAYMALFKDLMNDYLIK